MTDRAIEEAGAVLFFDEADALFGRRSAVKDSHDRYASSEVEQLLRKIESYPGIVILSTNLQEQVDDSLVPRLRTVDFTEEQG